MSKHLVVGWSLRFALRLVMSDKYNIYVGALYDPMLRSFTGMDPVDYQEDNFHSFNRYAYANNNLYKYVDPDRKHPLVYMLGGSDFFS